MNQCAAVCEDYMLVRNAIREDLPEIAKVHVTCFPDYFSTRVGKKNNGYLLSILLSDLFGLYRQNYCGCEFSKGET